MLPTNAKMTALVCSGRRRLNVVYGKPKLSAGQANCRAIHKPTSRPTAPNRIEANMNLRTVASSYATRSMRVVMTSVFRLRLRGRCCGLRFVERRQGEPVSVIEGSCAHGPHEEDQRPHHQHEAHEDLKDDDAHRACPRVCCASETRNARTADCLVGRESDVHIVQRRSAFLLPTTTLHP